MTQMTPQETSSNWKILMEYLQKISDPILRKSIYCDFCMRAESEWGYCPGKVIYPNKEPDLDEWEKDFLEDIKLSIDLGFNVRKEKSEKTYIEACARMTDFIRKGNSYEDIPEYVRSIDLRKLYIECLLNIVDEDVKSFESLKNNS